MPAIILGGREMPTAIQSLVFGLRRESPLWFLSFTLPLIRGIDAALLDCGEHHRFGFFLLLSNRRDLLLSEARYPRLGLIQVKLQSPGR